MENEQEFKQALRGKKIPVLVLDQKWHRLFAIHGKTEEISQIETRLKELLGKQGKLNQELKELKRLKGKLMDSIVQNMDSISQEGHSTLQDRKMEEDKRLIDEINEKMDAYEDELLDLPNMIRLINEELMILSMEYFYEKIRVNKQEADEIAEWIDSVRVELKKNIIRKQNREINNREIYSYLHDILGPEVLDIFDIKYHEEEKDEQEENQDSSQKGSSSQEGNKASQENSAPQNENVPQESKAEQ